MIIICPSCSAQYNLPANAVGESGRKVQCAQCQTHWRAFPEVEQAQELAEEQPVAVGQSNGGGPEAPLDEQENRIFDSTPANGGGDEDEITAMVADRAGEEDDVLFDSAQEAELDAAFEEAAVEADEEEQQADSSKESTGFGDGSALAAALGEIAGGPANSGFETKDDDAERERRREALQRRHAVLARNLPRQRMQRWVRVFAAVTLMVVLAGTFGWRENWVRTYPELANLYRLVGLNVNVVGLEVENVQTVRALRDGVETLQIKSQIVNVGGDLIAVPRVHIELLGSSGQRLYEWTATPQVSILRPDESSNFISELSTPPQDAVEIRIGFVEADLETGPEGV